MHQLFALIVQGGVGKHDVVAQALGVEMLPALEGYGLAAFQGFDLYD
jgi:hypothetical protein